MDPKQKNLPVTVLGAGLLGFCLRLVLYRTGFDDKNILSSSHPLHLLCLALTAFAAVYLLLMLRKLGGTGDPEKDFPDSPLRSLGLLAAACLTGLHALALCREAQGPLALVRTVLAFGGTASMALCALPGMARRRVHTGLLGIITAYYALDMLSRYQNWSGEPQLPDYVFQVFACVLLSLTSYHRLAFATGLGKRRVLLFCCLMSLFLCLVCAAGPETGAFYLGGLCWTGSCLCTLQPPAEEQEEADVPA